jgi:hypothetical protein
MWLDWRAKAGVPPSSVNGMGVGMSLSCAPAKGATLRSRNYSLAVRNNQRKVWAAWLSQTKAARGETGGK